MATKRFRFKGRVNDSRLQMYDRESFQEGIKVFNGRDIYITMEPFSQQRSSCQNNYYWAVIITMLCEELGYNKYSKTEREWVHTALRKEFLSINDGKLETYRSTTELNTAEYEEYLRSIRMWANTEYGIVIPKPNEIIIEDDFTFTKRFV